MPAKKESTPQVKMEPIWIIPEGADPGGMFAGEMLLSGQGVSGVAETVRVSPREAWTYFAPLPRVDERAARRMVLEESLEALEAAHKRGDLSAARPTVRLLNEVIFAWRSVKAGRADEDEGSNGKGGAN